MNSGIPHGLISRVKVTDGRINLSLIHILNNKDIHVSDVSDMDEAFVALGFPDESQKYKPLAEHIVHELYGNGGGMRLQGAAAAELCYVAAGRVEARREGLLGPWDIAAGS